MKDARYLIRLANQQGERPERQSPLLERLREKLRPLDGKAINLRVTPRALEFDVFCRPSADPNLFLRALADLGPVLTCRRLIESRVPVSAPEAVSHARALFNEHRFWEVHEALEALWKERSGPEKQWVQGLILAAAALVHAQKNEAAAVRPMLEDARRRLDGAPASYYGWDVADFRVHLERWIARREIDFPTV